VPNILWGATKEVACGPAPTIYASVSGNAVAISLVPYFASLGHASHDILYPPSILRRLISRHAVTLPRFEMSNGVTVPNLQGMQGWILHQLFIRKPPLK